MTRTTKPSRTLAACDANCRRRINMQKAQSGTIAEARLYAAAGLELFALTAAGLTDEERRWYLDDATRESRRANRQLACAKSHRYAVIPAGPGITEARVMFDWRCNQRTCALCAVKRSRDLHQRLVTAYFRALERMPGVSAIDLTLTQPPHGLHQLGDGIDKLHKGIRTLFRTPEFEAATVGRFRNTECVFKPDTQQWHIHAHNCVMVVPGYLQSKNYLKHQRIMELWAETLGLDGFVSVSVKLIRDPVTHAADPQSVAKALWHSAKYVTKPSSIFKLIDPNTQSYEISQDVASAHAAGMHGKRMSEFAGIMRPSWKPKTLPAKHRRPR